MHEKIITGINETFDGIVIDTCAKRTRILSEVQYILYCRKFGFRPAMKKTIDRRVKGIVEKKRSISTELIQITFKDLDLVIYV